MRLALLAVMSSAFACHVIEGDRILGSDVASASPLFAALDPHLEIGAAPLAGVQRVMRPEELVRLAKQNGIALDGPASAICFTRATELMTAEILMPILQKALAIDNARIEILDFSRFGIPRGTFDFPKSSLTPNGLWRGRILYGESHSMPVWVKARITVERTWVEAVETLPAGKAIEASQLILKTGPRFPFDTALVESIESGSRAPSDSDARSRYPDCNINADNRARRGTRRHEWPSRSKSAAQFLISTRRQNHRAAPANRS